ncbi:hypothetical protein [Halococcus thailandensis]|uniref:SEC-C motif domain-containing protein n=1 Tax=Halococcus thailandensis JCM 13552 TaxID=1227457 RepID=M0MY23_9EURY|nr:hypothetical protein [Halococcus thailandensis]EMA50218.1 SEC-C motif domain-containing protein [Halococcus thailandensis JCM 13552]
MTGGTIRDIPKIRELLETAQELSRFEQIFPLIKPVMEQIGVDVDGVEEALADIEKIEQEVNELATLPDRFNEQFVERGWICYEKFHIGVAKTAVELAEAGNTEAAEKELVAYYESETIEQQLNWLKQVDPFLDKAEPVVEKEGEFVDRETQSRFDLAQKALEDYDAGRYHACVPIVWALADGLAQQSYVNAHSQGGALSSEEANHEAWNSIAGHSTGLERLKGVVMTGRKATRTEKIEIPYRHGIMHGMDLNYDNEIVAAKTWNILFAVGEWAREAETDNLAPSGNEGGSEFSSVLEQLQEAAERHKETQKSKKRIEEWEAREITVGKDIPASGDPEEYADETPERALITLLSKWNDENYGHMAQFLRGADGEAEEPGFIKDQFKNAKLKSFELTNIDGKPAASDITVRLCIERFGEDVAEKKEVRMVRIADDGTAAAVWGSEEGEWVLPSWPSLL